MIKMLLTLAVFSSVGSFADFAMAQGQQGDAFGSDISSQCAHRRIMTPNLREGCAHKPPSHAQLGHEQVAESGSGHETVGSWLGEFGSRTGGANQQPDQRDEEQPKARLEQPKSATPP